MKSKIYCPVIISIIIALVFLSSCEKYKCIEGNGIVTLDTKTLNSYTGIISRGSYSIDIIEDTVHEVTIRADENLIPYISVAVKNQTLIIENVNNRCLRSDREIIVEVRMPELQSVTLEGSGDIYSDSVFTDRLDVELLGSGEIELFNVDALFINAYLGGSGVIELHGICNETDFALPGSGQILADLLRQDDCRVDLSGSGDMYVFALDRIYGTISGSGIVFYKGRPRTLNVEVTGTGNVLPL